MFADPATSIDDPVRLAVTVSVTFLVVPCKVSEPVARSPTAAPAAGIEPSRIGEVSTKVAVG